MSMINKRLKKTVKIITILMKSGLLKRKKIEDLHIMVKKSGKRLAKCFISLMLSGKKRSSFAHFGHYEFSCSSTNRHNFYQDLTRIYRHSFADENVDCNDKLKDVNDFKLVKEEKDVDRKAEEFIARFHEQLRLQRQRSVSRYEEMLARGAD